MMNYKEMKDWELLAERSYMEQLGFSGEVQLLEIDEELNKRREDKPQEIRYTKNAVALLYKDKVEFWAREGGAKKMEMTIGELYQDRHLLSFYRSEYLTNGIKARVMNELSKR